MYGFDPRDPFATRFNKFNPQGTALGGIGLPQRPAPVLFPGKPTFNPPVPGASGLPGVGSAPAPGGSPLPGLLGKVGGIASLAGAAQDAAGGSPFNGLVKGATTGASVGGPVGAAVGAGAGLLLGLFGGGRRRRR